MTIASETNKSGPYNGNGSTTAFDYDFKITDETHLSVILNVDGVETVQTLTTHYTVSGVGDAGGGQVNFVTAPASGETVTIILDIPFTQETDLENQGAYYAETIEAALDLAAQRDLQLKEQVDRSVKLPASSDVSGLDDLIADIVLLADYTTELAAVSGSIVNVNAVGDDIANVNTVAGSIANVNTVAGSIANVNTVAGIDTEVATVAGDSTYIQTCAGIAADITVVAGIGADVSAVAGRDTEIAALGARTTEIDALYAEIGSISTKANIDGSNISDAATFRTNIAALKTDGSNVSDAATFRGNIGVRAAEVGEITDYAGSTAPTGWLLCYGQNVSRTTYAALFAKIGTTFGAGDGSTTFGIPDLRGRVTVGKDNMGGSAAGRMTGSSGLSPNGTVLGSTGGQENNTLTRTQLPTDAIAAGGAFADQGATGSTGRGGGGSHNNVQPSIILNKIIYAGA
jgi:microcystin-dependent protein